jgi:hypothetical protein
LTLSDFPLIFFNFPSAFLWLYLTFTSNLALFALLLLLSPSADYFFLFYLTLFMRLFPFLALLGAVLAVIGNINKKLNVKGAVECIKVSLYIRVK